MNVKNYYVSNLNVIIDMYVKGLSLNNIDYLVIKNNNYIEIHFLNNIYRFYGAYKEKVDLIVDDKFIYESLKDIKLCANENYNAKNRSGYKVLKKNDYKKGPNSKKRK